MLSKKYGMERASVLNTRVKTGAALVIAALKPELKSVELSAFSCSSCGTHFSSNAGSEPFCMNCGSGSVTAAVKTVQTASLPRTDENMTSIHCGTCGTYNLVESATDKVLAGLAHCVCCGTSLVYDVNDGGADPADTRPPIREQIPTIEHAESQEQQQDQQQEQEQASNLAAETRLNDGQPTDGVSPPNQRIGDMNATVETVVAETEDQQDQQAQDQQQEQEQASNLAAETRLNDGQPTDGVSPPNQRVGDMESEVETFHATAAARESRWQQQADGMENDFVEPLDGAQDDIAVQQQGQENQQQTATQQQQGQGQQQQAADQQQQQAPQQQQGQGQQQQQRAPIPVEQADIPTYPAQEVDLGDQLQQQQGCDMPNVPALAMSLAAVVCASARKHELSLVSYDGGVIAQVNGVQVATLTPELAGDNAKVMHTRAFHLGVAELAKTQGVRASLKHFGFAETKVNFPQTQTVAALVEKRVAEQASTYRESVTDMSENYAHSLQLAAAGLNKGRFKGKDNPLKKTLASVLTTHGIRNAEQVIQAAFNRAADAYHETLLEVAGTLLQKGPQYRNELAEILAETTPPDLGQVEDGYGQQTVESRLEAGGMTPSVAPSVPRQTPETASTLQTASVFEMRKRLGGRVF